MADPVWVDGQTPLNAANMTKLQTRDERGVPNGYAPLGSDSKVPAPNLPDLTGTYQALSQKNQVSGYLGIDSGGGTVLSGYYQVAASSGGLAFRQTADANWRFICDQNGSMSWGPGPTGADVILSRSSANTLQVSGNFNVTGPVNGYNQVYANLAQATTTQVWIGQNGGTAPYAAITFGGDTNLYRVSAGRLQMDGCLYVNGADASGYGLVMQGGCVSFLRPAGSPILTSVSGGDTGYRYYLDNNGTMQWGPGNTPSDTNLYRYAAGVLKSDGQVWFTGTATAAALRADALQAGSNAIAIGYSTDSQRRFVIAGDGGMTWGDGTNARDTNLYRGSYQRLVTDGSFFTNRLAVNPGGGSGGAQEIDIWNDGNIYFGSDASVLLYRFAAGVLATNTSFVVKPGDAAGQIKLNDPSITANACIFFGSAKDAYLYRSAASVLATDTSFQVGGTIYANGNAGVSGYTALSLYVNSVGQRQVAVGVPDSGGSGFRVLVVPN